MLIISVCVSILRSLMDTEAIADKSVGTVKYADCREINLLQ